MFQDRFQEFSRVLAKSRDPEGGGGRDRKLILPDRDVYADPDHGPGPVLVFDAFAQDPAHLAPVDEHVVGPFELNPSRLGGQAVDGRVHGHARQQRQPPPLGQFRPRFQQHGKGQ